MLYLDSLLGLAMLRLEFCRAWRMASRHWERRVPSSSRCMEKEGKELLSMSCPLFSSWTPCSHPQVLRAAPRALPL